VDEMEKSSSTRKKLPGPIAKTRIFAGSDAGTRFAIARGALPA
jgi:hypothetical protein